MNGQSDGGLRGLGKEQDVKEAKGRQGVWAELEEGQSQGGTYVGSSAYQSEGTGLLGAENRERSFLETG